MSLLAILALGFVLGMRHATDPDHVVAVSTIVSRERSWRLAAPIGLLWGLGHTATILLVGGVIIVFEIVIPPRLGLGMELGVALMLVLLGVINVRSTLRGLESARPRAARSLRPLFVGIVHGLAGSAAVALLVLGAIRDARWAMGYLLLFGIGTIAGMSLITMAFATPMAAVARRFEHVHRGLVIATGLASVAYGAGLIYEIAIVHGLLTSHPQWTPQ